MVDYSCKHYQIKCAKSEEACKEYAEQAKNYADSVDSSAFVKTIGDQTIDGTKTFTSPPQVKNVVGKNSRIHLSDTTANSEIDIMQATSNGKNQFLVRFANGNRYPFVISQDTSNNANFIYELLSSPAASDNSNKIATTAWVNNKKADIIGWGIPDFSTLVSMSLPFTAPFNCCVFVSASRKPNNSSNGYIDINGVHVVGFSNVAGQSVGNGSLQIAVNKGDIVSISGSAENILVSAYCKFKGVK